jgi:hypothetical protein
LEDISDASFLGKLLVLPANVRLDWKGIARYKHTSLFDLIISKEEKKFYNIDTCGLSYKTIMIVIMMIVVTLQIVASLTIIIDDTS